jgi:hypothetical protein
MFQPTAKLLRFRDHARQMQTTIDVPLPERQLWRQLADEIEAYTLQSPSVDTPTQGEGLF